MKGRTLKEFWRSKFLHVDLVCCDRCGQEIKGSAAILYYPRNKVVKVICSDCENLLTTDSLKHYIV